MEEQLISTREFFENEVPELLSNLDPNTSPVWGKMTPQHMVEHLIVIFKLSIGRISVPVASKKEDHERLKAYLMQDSPMRRSVPSPTGNDSLQPLRSPGLNEAVDKLKKEITQYLAFAEEQPEFIANHPYGGPMNAQEWLLFHRKHFKHHFIQFGLIPDYE